MEKKEYLPWYADATVMVTIVAVIFMVGLVLGYLGIMPHYHWNISGGTA